ncbi:MAG: site-2 protease family protein [Acidobacteriota bacterium]
MEITPDFFALGLIWYVVFLFSVTLHEAAHAWAALRLGDSTAYHGGQVTLNPGPHLAREPVGTVVLPLLSYGLMGWMMGWASAPYDPVWADRYPRRAAWMALAGPVSNLAVAIVAGLALWWGLGSGFFAAPSGAFEFSRIVVAPAGGGAEGIAALLSILFALNVLLFLFNLLPLPPLDGASLLPLVLSEDASRSYNAVMRQPGYSLLGLVVAWKLFPSIFWPAMTFALGLVYSGLPSPG